jgi:NAD(P)-dependent dehydrogenase (short-subunit alcohol dehydrogenase family)
MTAARTALVTGAGSGIGFAIARRLLADGWHVVGVDRDSTGLDTLAADHADGRLRTASLDITDEAAVVACVEDAAADGLTGLVNSAGIGRDVPFLDTTPELFRSIYEVNVISTFPVSREAARYVTGQTIAVDGGFSATGLLG